MIWATCLLLAGLNHARVLLLHGLSWDYHGANPGSAFYWTSLTFIDPLVAVLLLVRPRWGVPATGVLIVTNVLHNLAITARQNQSGAFLGNIISNWQILSQIGFLIFVVATWQIAWSDIRRGGRRRLS